MDTADAVQVGAALKIQAHSRSKATRSMLTSMRIAGKVAHATRKLRGVGEAQSAAQEAVAADVAGNVDLAVAKYRTSLADIRDNLAIVRLLPQQQHREVCAAHAATANAFSGIMALCGGRRGVKSCALALTAPMPVRFLPGMCHGHRRSTRKSCSASYRYAAPPAGRCHAGPSSGLIPGPLRPTNTAAVSLCRCAAQAYKKRIDELLRKKMGTPAAASRVAPTAAPPIRPPAAAPKPRKSATKPPAPAKAKRRSPRKPPRRPKAVPPPPESPAESVRRQVPVPVPPPVPPVPPAKPPEIEAFDFFDRDGDGYISIEELYRGLVLLNVDGLARVTWADVEAMMRGADANGDGALHFAEFLRMARLGALRAATEDLNQRQAASLEAISAGQHYAVRLPATWADPQLQMHLAEVRGSEKARSAAATSSRRTMARAGATSRGRECSLCAGRTCCCYCGLGEEVGRVLSTVWLQMRSSSLRAQQCLPERPDVASGSSRARATGSYRG